MPVIPNSFTDVFGGSPVQPSNVSYQSFTLPPSIVLSWPVEGLQTNNVVSRFIDLDATASGQTITMPDATQVSVGTDVLFRNLGPNDIQILDNTGAEIAVLLAYGSGVTNAVYFILTSNATQAGTWGTVAFGATGSAPFAAAIAGNGLVALNNKLNTNTQITTLLSTNYVATDTDRAKYFVYTGGIGTFTLPQANAVNVGNGFLISVANRSVTGGQLTVIGQSGALIDGQSSLVLSLDQDCMFITDGTNWTSFGLGILTFFLTGISNVVLNNDTLITVPADDATKQIQIFTGVQDANTTVVYPNIAAIYYILNNTNASSFVLNVNCNGSLVTTAVPNGERYIFYCDGTTMQPVPSSLANGAFPDGTAGVPSITFRDAIGDGWFLPTAHHIGLSMNGAQIIDYNVNGVEFLINGSNTNPTLTWQSANGGFYWDNVNDYVKIALGGIDRFGFSSSALVSPDGSVAFPAYSFLSDKTKGISGAVVGELSYSIAGAKVALMNNHGLEVIAGTAANPSLAFIGDTTSGFYDVSVGTIGISISGAEVGFINSSGFTLSASKALALTNPAGTFTTSLVSGAVIANTPYTLPTAYPGSNGQILSCTTAGVMSWIVPGSGSLSLPDGTAAAPSLFFTTHPTTGIYEPAADTIGFTAAGVEIAAINSTGLSVQNGSVSFPSISFFANSSTGFYYTSGGGNINISCLASQVAKFNTSGLTMASTLPIFLTNPANTFTTSIASGAVTANNAYTLPTALPVANGQPMISTTGGTMSWASNALFDTNGMTIAATKSLSLTNPAGTFTTSLTSGAVTANTPYTLPTAYPTSSGQPLISDTSGNMSWAANVLFDTNGETIAATKSLAFFNPAGTFKTSFTGGAVTGNVSYTLPTADGSSGQALSTNGSGVLSWKTYIPQIAQTVLATTFNTTVAVANTFTDLTGLSVTITPQATTSKILITGNVQASCNTANTDIFVRIERNGTPIGVGSPSASQIAVTATNLSTSNDWRNLVFNYLDSPATTSATTYKLQISCNNAGTVVYVNQEANDNGTSTYQTPISVITVQEYLA